VPDVGTKLVITAGGVIYKPKSFTATSSELKVEPGFETTELKTSVNGGNGIRYSYLEVRDQKGKRLWFKDKKEGLVENSLWDWKDENGGMVGPDEFYLGELMVTDEYGQTGRSAQETLKVVKTNQSEISERLILVQFAFADVYGEPDYASVRIQHLAQQVVNRAQYVGNTRIVVGGHTDTIGVATGNVKLSTRRAEEQMRTVRDYMMRILNFKDEHQLDEWLSSHTSAMSYRGYGPERPYIVTRKFGDVTRQIMIGDNKLPEGRIINRRVEIEFMPMRK
jgi:outer membrane protein OmpA-like peptidoglycan-associated protein